MTTHRQLTPGRNPNPLFPVPSRKARAAAPAVQGASAVSLDRFTAMAGGPAAR
jgi:hypothetical protein